MTLDSPEPSNQIAYKTLANVKLSHDATFSWFREFDIH